MRKPRKTADSIDNRAGFKANCARGGICGGCVLGIVVPRQGFDLGQRHHLGGLAVHVVVQHAVECIDPARDGLRGGNSDDANAGFHAGGRQIFVNPARFVVVQTDDGGGAARLTVEDPAFRGDIAFHAAMPVQMVRGDIDEQRHVAGQRGDQLQLIGRQFQHIIAVIAQRLEFDGRAADIAADFQLASGLAQDMAQKRGGRGFAVGAGDGDITRVGAGANQKFDVADDLRAAFPRRCRRNMRGRVGVRNAGAQHQRLDSAPVFALGQVRQRQSGLARRLAARFAVVPGAQLRPARGKRARRRQAGTGKAHDGDRLTGEEAEIDHRARSLLIAASGWPGRSPPGWRR